MPELPEVETTRRSLAPHVEGHVVRALIVRQARLRWLVPEHLNDQLAGQRITALTRRAKYLLWDIGQGTLVSHLGMSGTWRVLNEPAPLRTHDHLDLCLNSGVILRYHDPRRFGALLWHPDKHWEQHALLRSLGPEPQSSAFNALALQQQLKTKHVAIKLALMDQKVVVGVGNIYASEALFGAGIHPTHPANLLELTALQRLVAEVKQVLNTAITAGGSTLRDFVNSAGETGYFQIQHRVYGRTGAACSVCTTPIEQLKLGQRSSFFCPRCQFIQSKS